MLHVEHRVPAPTDVIGLGIPASRPADHEHQRVAFLPIGLVDHFLNQRGQIGRALFLRPLTSHGPRFGRPFHRSDRLWPRGDIVFDLGKLLGIRRQFRVQHQIGLLGTGGLPDGP